MFNKTIKIPVLTHAEKVRTSLSSAERWAFYLLAGVLLLSTLTLMSRVHNYITILVPSSGGKVTEGVIGAPRFVNPVLAISQTDKDLSELIYAGLMTQNIDGPPVPELAKSYSISDDALVYTFVLHKDLAFHDGTPLTTDDIIFTIEKAMQPDIKSPERANWEGVTVEKVDDLTITFTLVNPYAQFLQNTLLGILPQEHWGELTSDEFIFSKLNTEPIGSGPYKFVSALHSTSGIPSSFNLATFTDYIRGAPYIKKFTINFYAGADQLEKALQNGDIDAISEVSLQNVDALINKSDSTILTTTLPRIFAIFFNQSHNEVLAEKTVRKVLRDTIDKDALIKEVLGVYAESINSAILTNESNDTQPEIMSVEQARSTLEDAKWEIDEEDGLYHKGDLILSITLTTVSSQELKDIATRIANTWSDIGVQVKLEVFEPGNLTQSVLRTREYDALLFGEIVGTDPDLYAFWHSSQLNDPGLNIANYTNSTVDSLLVKARKTVDSAERAMLYNEASNEINKDIPAIFLYAPNYVYVTNKNILGIRFAQSMEPHARFADVHLWHIDTKKVWNFLEK